MGKSCFDCIHKSVCDAYERKGVTDFEKGNVTPCELFAPKKRFIELPFEIDGFVYRVKPVRIINRLEYVVEHIKVNSASMAVHVKSLWNEIYFSSKREANRSKAKKEKKL